MVWKGFRFGMILQLAIGPMCLFIFQRSISRGFWAGELGVLGTAVIDSLEIVLAVTGIGIVLEKSRRAARFLKYFGIAILLLYGAVSVCNGFGITPLRGMGRKLPLSDGAGNTFWQAVILALSDPLTIVFWSGIFSAKIVEEKMDKADLCGFACGCVLATLTFLTLVSAAGSMTKRAIPMEVVSLLNAAVGLMMFYFAYKNLRGDCSGCDGGGYS